MEHCHFIIIDEMSMLGCSLFKKIDLRCREAKPLKASQPFGGMFLYLLGDIKQLPPVLDRPFYGTGYKGSLHDQGQILYRSIPTCFTLNSSYRQNGEEQQFFRDLLDRLSVGQSTLEDWQVLMTREKSRLLRNEIAEFRDCLRLFPNNASVAAYNLQKLESLSQPVARISSDNNNAEAAKADCEKGQGLEKTLYLCKGSRVMLKTNLWTKKGLVNGALGTVVDIVYGSGKVPPEDRPLAVCIKFDSYTGPLMKNIVPIGPVTRCWKSGNVSCTRSQFPIILAWAVTIHKSQGLTLPKVALDIGTKELAPGCTYVALSRVKRLTDLIIEPGFNYDRLTRIQQMKLLALRVQEEQRLLSLIPR
uniref:ATP-dependent DNA helicase n=1 Tax=Cacopsylla melanoneura TaxID=428564 RepID=A0A8D9E7N4_9HEMI